MVGYFVHNKRLKQYYLYRVYVRVCVCAYVCVDAQANKGAKIGAKKIFSKKLLIYFVGKK